MWCWVSNGCIPLVRLPPIGNSWWLEFTGLDGKPVGQRGMHSYPPQTFSTHQMEADLRHGDITRAVELRILWAGGNTTPPHPDIQVVPDRYLVVFGDIPPGKPPDSIFEHTIELELGVKTVVTTPYRHPKA